VNYGMAPVDLALVAAFYMVYETCTNEQKFCNNYFILETKN